MQGVDDLIGIVVGSLIDNQELENTVIFFTSDNGVLDGEHRQIGKGLAYEESIRVPLFVRAPGYEGPNQVHQLVINNDIAPTILELSKAQADISLDGRSLVPLLADPEEKDWRQMILIDHWSNSYILLKSYNNVCQLSHPGGIYSGFTAIPYPIKYFPINPV